MAGKYTAEQIQDALGGLPNWAADGDSLVRQFKFKDHIAAMGFVTKVAMAAEVMNHHPDLRIVYNTVDIRLNSHDVGGVSERDVNLAKKIDDLSGGTSAGQ
ncbi:MAG: 4a-hydroxytetrahydrobiopterin dehydratase [Dehalococcoidia bacterium]|nr:4a-hydroxytetrahydrobiopterin dehydratase [Dehalococcoidia bacterium]